jgi:hypothetical protein
MNGVSDQDNAIIEKLEPILPAESRGDEFLVEPDRIISRFHESLDEWQSKGWRIDSRRLARYQLGEKVFAIPCPARRESITWVHDAIPLIPPKENQHRDADLTVAAGSLHTAG